MKNLATLYLIFVLALCFTLSAATVQSLSKQQLVPTISILSNDGIYGESVGSLCFSVSM